MKVLIVEDDFTSRSVLLNILRPLADCDVAVNGEEALTAFRIAVQNKAPYDLILLDIMMPEKDGQQVLKEIRQIEEKNGILGLDGAKIIMITALSDSENIMTSFRYQCEAYLVKPVRADQLLGEMHSLGLVKGERPSQPAV